MINIQYKETTNNINRSVYSMRKQHIYPSKRRTFPRVNLLSRSVRTYNMKTNDTDELWKKILVLSCHPKLTAHQLPMWSKSNTKSDTQVTVRSLKGAVHILRNAEKGGAGVFPIYHNITPRLQRVLQYHSFGTNILILFQR